MSLSSALRSVLSVHDPISLISPAAPLPLLKQIHSHLLTSGRLLLHPHLLASLVSALVLPLPDPLRLSHALLLLSHHPSVFAFNSFIRSYCKSPTPLLAFPFYLRILRSSHLSPDNYTYTFLVRACAQVPSLDLGAAVHGAVVTRGFARDPHVRTALVHMYAELGMLDSSQGVFLEVKYPDLVCRTAMVAAYAECGEVGLARELFDEMPERDLVAWNALIAGYEHVGRSREALDLFHRMQREGVHVNEATLVPVLAACADLGTLDQGKWAHVYIERNRLRMNVVLGTALIDMYAKCGDMGRAMGVFRKMDERNVYTWSSVIRGLSMNGDTEKCLELFERMKDECIAPNAVTFMSVLHGCSVAGLTERGRAYFDSMKEVYEIEPWSEHYGCMIDLYGRAGMLDDAVRVINSMPMEPHVEAWGALLHSCRVHGNKELGEYALGKILELESKHDGGHVLLSNIYAQSRIWDGVSKVREQMEARGVRKEPGCSVIEVDGEVHEFFVGCKTHPRYGEIEIMLREMARRLRLAGYVAKTDQVLFDIEEEEKVDSLVWHSEKVAIAFGLVSLNEHSVIRIVKNLRICQDCHDATKLLSKVFEREISIRDRNRFHHFKSGVCSCNDYW